MVAILSWALAVPVGAEGDAAAEGEAAEGDAAAEGDMAAQAGMQIVRFDLYYGASQPPSSLG